MEGLKFKNNLTVDERMMFKSLCHQALVDLSNKYRAALFGPDAQYRDDFVPSELSPFLDFERAYPAAAKALKKGAVLALDKVHGSTLTVGGSASPVQAATLAEVFEAANRLC